MSSVWCGVNALAQGLSRQGLHATAFEVAKLLLLLDPEDPMVGGLSPFAAIACPIESCQSNAAFEPPSYTGKGALY